AASSIAKDTGFGGPRDHKKREDYRLFATPYAIRHTPYFIRHISYGIWRMKYDVSEMNVSCQARHHGDQLVGINRLSHMHLEPGGTRAPAVFGSGVGRDRHGRDEAASLRLARAHLPDQIVPVPIRHRDV